MIYPDAIRNGLESIWNSLKLMMLSNIINQISFMSIFAQDAVRFVGYFMEH